MKLGSRMRAGEYRVGRNRRPRNLLKFQFNIDLRHSS